MPSFVTLYPAANGDRTEMTQGGIDLGSAYLNARAHDLYSWRNEAAVGKTDLFFLDQMPAEAGTIIGVDLGFFARREDAFLNCNVSAAYKFGGITVNTTDINVTLFEWTLFTFAGIACPDGLPWTVAKVNALQAGYTIGENKNRSFDQAYAFVSYLLSPTPAGGYIPREAPSQKLRRYGLPMQRQESTVPAWSLDCEVLDGMAWTNRRGPASTAMGPGWKDKRWQRRSTRLEKVSFDLNSMTGNLVALDRRFVDGSIWDAMITDRSSNAEAQGVARILSGATRRIIRSTPDYVEDPSDGTVRRILADGESIARVLTQGVAGAPPAGTLMESAGMQLIPRTAFKSGFAGWAFTPSSSAFSLDAGLLIWDPAMTANSAKIVATTSGRPEMTQVTFPAGAQALTSGGGIRFSASYVTDFPSASRFGWQLVRSTDLKWRDDAAGAWTSAGAVDNFFPYSPLATRGVAQTSFLATTSGETYTLHIFAEAGATLHVFDLDLVDLPWPTARILSDSTGAPATRSTPFLLLENFTGIRQDLLSASHGTIGVEFVPDWNPADVANTNYVFPVLVHSIDVGLYDTGHRLAFYYDGAAGRLVFGMTVAGVVTAATVAAAPARGVVARGVGRWTSAEGELNLPPRTLSAFYGVYAATSDGADVTTYAKGTDATRAGDQEYANNYGWIAEGSLAYPMIKAGFPGMTGWWRADYGALTDTTSGPLRPAVDGDHVHEWDDASLLGVAFDQPLLGGQPTYKANILNGYPVLRFDGGDIMRLGFSLATFLGTSGVGHMFVVFRTAVAVDQSVLLFDSNNKAGLLTSATSGAFGTTGVYAYNVTASSSVSTQLLPAAMNQWWCAEWIHSGAVTLYGSLLGANTTGTASAGMGSTTSGVVTIGNASFNGDIAEIAIFNNELVVSGSGGSLNHFQEYLQRKYGLPFFSSPLPVSYGGRFPANALIRRLRFTQHVLADDELSRLFI